MTTDLSSGRWGPHRRYVALGRGSSEAIRGEDAAFTQIRGVIPRRRERTVQRAGRRPCRSPACSSVAMVRAHARICSQSRRSRPPPACRGPSPSPRSPTARAATARRRPRDRARRDPPPGSRHVGAPTTPDPGARRTGRTRRSRTAARKLLGVLAQELARLGAPALHVDGAAEDDGVVAAPAIPPRRRRGIRRRCRSHRARPRSPPRSPRSSRAFRRTPPGPASSHHAPFEIASIGCRRARTGRPTWSVGTLLYPDLWRAYQHRRAARAARHPGHAAISLRELTVRPPHGPRARRASPGSRRAATAASGTASRSQLRQKTTLPSSDSTATARAWPAASGTSGIASSRREPNAYIGTCGPGTFVTVTLNSRVPYERAREHGMQNAAAPARRARAACSSPAPGPRA